MNSPYRLVFFDVDSTLVTIEGIDILGGGDPKIVELTEAAMNGAIPLEEVYARRLELIRPTRTAVEALAARYGQSLVEGAAQTIDALQRAGAIVHVVTAGVEQAIAPLALIFASWTVVVGTVFALNILWSVTVRYRFVSVNAAGTRRTASLGSWVHPSSRSA